MSGRAEAYRLPLRIRRPCAQGLQDGSEGPRGDRDGVRGLDAASMTWVGNDGKGDIMDLYDECLAALRG